MFYGCSDDLFYGGDVGNEWTGIVFGGIVVLHDVNSIKYMDDEV